MYSLDFETVLGFLARQKIINKYYVNALISVYNSNNYFYDLFVLFWCTVTKCFRLQFTINVTLSTKSYNISYNIKYFEKI